jgi:fibronectin type 3 domain-containing protein
MLLLFTVFPAGCGKSGGGSSSPPPVVPTAVPNAPESIAATAVSTGQIVVSWKSVAEASSYSVYRSTQTGTAYSVTVVANTTATLVSDATVSAGTPYYYIVTGANSIGEGPSSVEVSATPATPGGTLTIQGAITYEDKKYDQLVGQTGATVFKAVRHAEVQLINAATSAVLMSAATDSNGLYSIPTSTNTGNSVYVRVLASSNPGDAQQVNVRNLGSSTYAVKTANFTLNGDTNVNLAIPVTNQADGAFNVLDVFTSGFEFVNSLANAPTLSLNAFWQPNNQYGTYYCPSPPDPIFCPGGVGIYVLSDATNALDTDEFDDDVLWHEFGHFALDKFSRDDSPGGAHYLNENTQDLRLSWSEGWGNFFQGAVKYWIDGVDPDRLSDPGDARDVYVDTQVDVGSGGIYLTIGIATPDASPHCYFFDNCKYATNEIAVANVLWQLMTEPGLGMAPLWDVIDNYMPTVAYTKLEDFWDGWLSVNGTGDLGTLNAIYSTRLITYQLDGFETDNTINDIMSAPSYTPGMPQTHTIYGTGDEDFVQFNATSNGLHTFSTGTLRNGADTYLTLHNDLGNPLATNDNTITPPADPPNDTTTLSSRIQHLLTSGQIYYVSVKSSANRPASAGRYGSYTLTITTP